MIEKSGSYEKESCLGLSTLEMAKRIVDSNSRLKETRLRAYYYVPDKPSGNEEKTYPLSRCEFLSLKSENLEKLCIELGQGYNIALDSNVILDDNSRGHFIMADLAPQKSDDNLKKIKEQFKEIIQPKFGGGFLLETKKSYHFIGENIVLQDDWHDLLGRLLITSIVTFIQEGTPRKHEVIVDYRYIGHSLIRGSTGLRLTTNGTKTVSPRVAAYI